MKSEVEDGQMRKFLNYILLFMLFIFIAAANTAIGIEAPNLVPTCNEVISAKRDIAIIRAKAYNISGVEVVVDRPVNLGQDHDQAAVTFKGLRPFEVIALDKRGRKIVSVSYAPAKPESWVVCFQMPHLTKMIERREAKRKIESAR